MAREEEEEYEIIDRASCCWQCARLSALLLLLSINNIITAICAAYLARTAWCGARALCVMAHGGLRLTRVHPSRAPRFDDWFNGTGLSAMNAKLASTVPRCNADALWAIAAAAGNATSATAVLNGGGGVNGTAANATVVAAALSALRLAQPAGSLHVSSRGRVCGFF